MTTNTSRAPAQINWTKMKIQHVGEPRLIQSTVQVAEENVDSVLSTRHMQSQCKLFPPSWNISDPRYGTDDLLPSILVSCLPLDILLD